MKNSKLSPFFFSNLPTKTNFMDMCTHKVEAHVEELKSKMLDINVLLHASLSEDDDEADNSPAPPASSHSVRVL